MKMVGMMTRLALVRIRGIRSTKPAVTKTFELLKLTALNNCVLVADTPQMRGMINKVKDYIAFGEVGEKTIKDLMIKRGTRGSKRLKNLVTEEEIAKAANEFASGGSMPEGFVDPVFRLRPPRGGFKCIKLTYPRGDTGYRDDMIDLIRRMK